MALSRFLHSVISGSARATVLASLLIGAGALALTGCAGDPACQGAHDYKEKPPLYGEALRVGHGKQEYYANNPGRAFAYDKCEHRTINSATLKAGDTYVIDPEGSKIRLNGEVIATPDLNPQHVYELYWVDGYDRDSVHDNHGIH